MTILRVQLKKPSPLPRKPRVFLPPLRLKGTSNRIFPHLVELASTFAHLASSRTQTFTPRSSYSLLLCSTLVSSLRRLPRAHHRLISESGLIVVRPTPSRARIPSRPHRPYQCLGATPKSSTRLPLCHPPDRDSKSVLCHRCASVSNPYIKGIL